MKKEQDSQALLARLAELETLLAARDAALAEQENSLADKDKALAEQKKVLADKEEMIAKLEEDNEKKRLRILQLERMIFGRRSEKRLPEIDDGQLMLPFDDGDQKILEIEKKAQEAVGQIEKVAEARRQKKEKKEARKPEKYRVPANLPVEETTVYPEEYNKEEYDVIGCTSKDELGYRPSSFYCKRTNYAVIRRKDEKNAPNPTIIKVDRSAEPLKGCYCSIELASQIITDKFLNHLPEYRQSADFKRLGFDIPTSTINRWVHATANALRPLYKLLGKRIKLLSDYIQVDETVSKINDTPLHVRQAYTWVVRDATPAHRGVYFLYDKGSRSRDVIVNYLEDFRGTLQSDGYAAYSVYEDKQGVIPLGCLAHVRRKFENVLKIDPRAQYPLNRIATLYALEANLKDSHATPEEIQKARQESAYPILQEIEAWMKTTFTKTTPQSPLALAIRYANGIWFRIARYTLDGRYNIDNNAVERRIRPLTLGRKNYLFSHYDDRAEDNALFYSLIGTCLENNIEPPQWLINTLSKLRTDMDDEQLATLLP